MHLYGYFGLTTTLHLLASAASCTRDIAIPWALDSSSGDSDSAINAEISAEGEANALGLIGKRAIADLDCASSETCLVYTDNTLFCLDANSGDFHDDSGGIGNVITGDYIASGGEDIDTSTATASGAGSEATVKSEGAISCTSDVAESVEAADASGGTGMDAAIQAGANCAAVAAVGTSSCSRKRASSSLECSSGEMCILYGASVLLCLEPVSGDFHDEYEGKGNVYSTEYTAANGDPQTITGTMVPTLPATGTASKATATSSGDSGGTGPSSGSSTQISRAASRQLNGDSLSEVVACGPLLAVFLSFVMVAKAL